MTCFTTRSRSTAGAATSTGNRRTANEDSHVVAERFCIVADGMGGHVAGGVASSVAADQIARHLAGAPVIEESTLHRAVEVAHREVLLRAVLDDTDGMGTTVVLAAIATTDDGEPAIAIAHVGDSRCYRLADGELELVTADHSLVHELVRSGRCSVAEAAAHPMANVITRAVGVEQLALAEVTLLPPRLLPSAAVLRRTLRRAARPDDWQGSRRYRRPSRSGRSPRRVGAVGRSPRQRHGRRDRRRADLLTT